MTLTNRPPARPGGFATAARRRIGPRTAAILVGLLGLILTAVLAVVTFQAHQRAERRVLALQTRLIAAAGQAQDQLYVEDHLGGAASLAVASGGDMATFRKAMRATVTAAGPFIAASLWHLTGTSPHLVTALGARPLLAPDSGRFTTLLHRAAATGTFVVARITEPHALRLGFAAAAGGPQGGYAVYAEEPLPADRRISDPPSSPLGPLNLAVYLGRAQTPAALLETDSAGPLPLQGTTFTTSIVFGDTFLTTTTSARSSLTGTVSAVLPWAVIAGGLLLTLLAAVFAGRLVRGRADAERLSREIGDLYTEQRSVAETLQQALLPQRLPDIPGMHIEARYLPGARGVDIGGDWYDVVPLADGRFVFKVGDVSGRGVTAATVMASLHFAGRAYALEGHPPQVILDQLARTLDVAQDGRFATVLCGLVDVAAHTVTLANAGHLPPLIRHGGKATPVTMKPGPPIGIPDGSPYQPFTMTMPAHGVLVAYTDGLVERRGEMLDAGIARLQDAASQDSPSLGELLDSIITKLTGDSPTDDIALIGLKWLN
jgi:hypothetical protein